VHKKWELGEAFLESFARKTVEFAGKSGGYAVKERLKAIEKCLREKSSICGRKSRGENCDPPKTAGILHVLRPLANPEF